MNPDYYIGLSAILFTIGLIGFMTRRNAIVAFMCVELMLNAANLSLVTFARVHGALDGQVGGLLRHGGGRGGGRGGTRHHRLHLPHPPVGLGRRRQPVEVLRGQR